MVVKREKRPARLEICTLLYKVIKISVALFLKNKYCHRHTDCKTQQTHTVQLFGHKAVLQYWLLNKRLQAVTMQRMWEPCVRLCVCLDMCV